MSIIRRSFIAAAALSALAPLSSVLAQSWPTKPVHIVVPAPAGSSLDVVARLLGDKLKDRWGQPVIIDNKPGAGGMLGMDVAAKASPDGTTIAVGFNGPVAFAPFMYRKMPYDPAKDLTPVVMTTSQPNVLAVNANVPAKNVKEFVAWAKEKNGKMNYASIGQGSSSHLTMELFLTEAGITATHVPYNGSPPAGLSIAQGDTDALFAVAPALLPLQKSGKVRFLAVTSRQRPESLRDVPTMAEAGLPDVESLAWNGLFVAAGTPEAVVHKISADVNAVLHDPSAKATLDNQGLMAVGGSPADFRKVVEADTKRWGPIINKLGIKLDQ